MVLATDPDRERRRGDIVARVGDVEEEEVVERR